MAQAKKAKTANKPEARKSEVLEPTQQTDYEGNPLPDLPDLSWMGNTFQWGTKALPEKYGGGLTLAGINIGIYGDIPEHIPHRNRLPRGAVPVVSAGNIGGYYIQDKYEQWADSSPYLYEEAISRRWASATDIPWDTGHGLSDDVEVAIAQVATELSNWGSVETEVVSAWLQNLSPGYHEVKYFLSTAVYDSSRMEEGYRKRAMLNGAGMMLESPGRMNRACLESYGSWSNTVLFMWLLRGSLMQAIVRYLSVYGPTEADRELAFRVLPDIMRKSAYACDHIRFAISKKPELTTVFNAGLTVAEFSQLSDFNDSVLWEALAIIFGDGVENMDQGMEMVLELQQYFVQTYIDKCNQANLGREAQTRSGAWAGILMGVPMTGHATPDEMRAQVAAIMQKNSGKK
ncbi:MAG: hypothetical protein VYD09_04025 [Chloroflexota bacterium]|nr:hypothetical protein [Chloroflexota bacterium]